MIQLLTANGNLKHREVFDSTLHHCGMFGSIPMAKPECSLPLYLLPLPPGVATYHAVRRRSVFDSPGSAASLESPGQHRQHYLHHPHQCLPRMRMMQVMLGMLLMLVKEKLQMKENAWK